MDVGSVTQQFFQLEQDLDLMSYKLGGGWLWERIRFQAHRRILMALGVIRKPHRSPQMSGSKRFDVVVNGVRNLVCRNPFLGSSADVVCFGHARRKLRPDRVWWDIYCDPFLEKTSLRYQYFGGRYQGKHLEPAKTANLRYLDSLILLGLGLRVVARRGEKYLSEADDWGQLIEVEVAARFGVNVRLRDAARNAILRRAALLPAYRLLLRRWKPRVALVVPSYGRETLVEACKAEGVPVAELQHGIIGSNHLAYSFPDPATTKHTFPDYLLVFGPFWRTACRYPIADERVIPVGFPYLEEEVDRYKDVAAKDDLLFISQGTIGHDLSRIAVEVARMLGKRKRVIYKLHPGEVIRWRSDYPWLVDAPLDVIEDESTPLYKLLAESQYHVGVNSTVLYEGLAFGRTPVVVDLPGANDMHGLLEAKSAFLARTAEDLSALVCSGQPPVPVHAEHFFTSGSVQKIHQSIRSIIDVSRPDVTANGRHGY